MIDDRHLSVSAGSFPSTNSKIDFLKGLHKKRFIMRTKLKLGSSAVHVFANIKKVLVLAKTDSSGSSVK